MTTAEKKAAAVALAEQWLQLFPLVPNRKQPLKGWNYRKATNSPQDVASWFNGSQAPDIAIKLVGVAVLDLDTHTSTQALSKARQWLLAHGVDVKQLQKLTYIERTPSGGVHMYFLTPDDFELKHKITLADGIELIADFITAYPSNGYHPLNGSFNVANLAPLPQALIKLAKTSKPAAAMHGASTSRTRGSYSTSPAGVTYLGSFIEEVTRGTSQGGRNSWFASVIGKMLASGANPEACYDLTRAINGYFTTPPLPTNELEKTFNSILKRHLEEVRG